MLTSINVTVQLGYLSDEFIISWTLSDPKILSGDIFILRSDDGVAFTPLNTIPIKDSDYYTDTYKRHRDTDTVYYKVLIKHNGEMYKSNSVGLLDKLNCVEQNVVKKILNLDLWNLSQWGRGIELFLYKPLLDGEACPYCQSMDSKQNGLTAQCKHCYGTGILGGFNKPTKTYVQRLTPQQLNNADLGDRAITNVEELQFTILPYPKVRIGDFIYLPQLGEKWIIKSLEINLFKGFVPISTKIVCSSMLRDDIRWSI